jgi:hypothetical protein
MPKELKLVGICAIVAAVVVYLYANGTIFPNTGT